MRPIHCPAIIPAMDLGIAGRSCIVTGASRGIGLATARMLAAEGASVLLVARDRAALLEAAGSIEGGEVDTIAADVTDPDAAQRIVAECERRFERVDVLVNNAGTSQARPLGELTDEEWRQQWELHVMGSLRLMRVAAPAMAERGWGRIVNVGSSSGRRPSLTNAAYTVSKAAQHMLSRVFADAYAPKGVLVNTVSPGPVESSLWMAEGGLADQVAKLQGISREEAFEATRSKVPLGRFGTENEIAAVVTFLCSEWASDVAGANWSVDGGTVPLP
ncbi:MAG: 3-oxoacyl-[acyl-carrier protein] reductase [Thermoleophilaceae bacterium]|jgi:3-oxoacyl-[acyl-carrier protein] reductase|nr:3-oxoacyl-[acyl-carrier protein] reductase [Thermoleophilaceae bacterium]